MSVHNVQTLKELLKPTDTVPEYVFILGNLIEYACYAFPFLSREVTSVGLDDAFYLSLMKKRGS
jgi:hypothetical protein